MPAQPLSDQQKRDAERLQFLWLAHKASNPEASQEKLAAECGWKTQGAVSQYMRGKIPLNLPALLKFSKALGVPAMQISPTLATQLPHPVQSAEITQDYKQKSTAAHTEQAQAAINNVASLDQVLADLVAHLVQADATTRAAAGGLLLALAQQPENPAMLASLTALLRPAAFTQQSRRAA